MLDLNTENIQSKWERRIWITEKVQANDQHKTDFDKKGLINIVGSAGLEYLAFDRFMWAPISVLPYMKIPISPPLSLKLDRIIRSLKLFNLLFVNQCIIARKPLY